MGSRHEGSAAGAHWVLGVLGCVTSSHPAAGIFSIVMNPTGFIKWDVMLSHNTLSKDAPFPFHRGASRTACHFLLRKDLPKFNHQVKIFHTDWELVLKMSAQ